MSLTADAKERGSLRGQISHNGRFGCDCCTLSKIDGVYPPFHRDGKTYRVGEMRSHEFHMEMLAEENAHLSVDERYVAPIKCSVNHNNSINYTIA